jgi:hypothetical protein
LHVKKKKKKKEKKRKESVFGLKLKMECDLEKQFPEMGSAV